MVVLEKTSQSPKGTFRVKTKIRRQIARRKQKVEDRLASAVVPNFGGPVLQGKGIRYELAERMQGIGCGGIGAMQALVRKVGLAAEIDKRVALLKRHVPYHESDHVLNIAYNILCGGRVLEDIELHRNDAAFLAALGTESIPDPTTAGDFCRRFDSADIWQLMEAVNETRIKVWKRHPSLTKETGRSSSKSRCVISIG